MTATAEITTEPRWLSPTEQCAWRSWLYSGFAVINNLDNDLKTLKEIDMLEYHILVQAVESGDSGVRIGDLAADIIASPQRTSQRVKLMVKNGLLNIKQDPDDGRARIITVTQQGIAKLKRAAPLHVESARRRFFDHLEPEEIETLAKISKKLLVQNLR